ncbi:UNVERIFIED_CONTAM: hypothetical protein Sindi_1716500 [Sesamum indicum]
MKKFCSISQSQRLEDSNPASSVQALQEEVAVIQFIRDPSNCFHEIYCALVALFDVFEQKILHGIRAIMEKLIPSLCYDIHENVDIQTSLRLPVLHRLPLVPCLPILKMPFKVLLVLDFWITDR